MHYADYVLTAPFILRIIQIFLERNALKAVMLGEYIAFVQLAYNLVVCRRILRKFYFWSAEIVIAVPCYALETQPMIYSCGDAYRNFIQLLCGQS